MGWDGSAGSTQDAGIAGAPSLELGLASRWSGREGTGYAMMLARGGSGARLARIVGARDDVGSRQIRIAGLLAVAGKENGGGRIAGRKTARAGAGLQEGRWRDAGAGAGAR